MKRIPGKWSICMRLLGGAMVKVGTGSDSLGIFRRSLTVLAVILVAVVGFLSPVFASTTDSSNYIQNLSLDADPQHLSSHAVSKIAVSGPYVHVVWLAYELDWAGKSLHYRRSTDGGKTFEAPILLVQDSPSDFFGLEFDQKYNNLVADGAYLHIFYTVGWPRKLNYIRSADNGGTFDPVFTLSSGYYTYDIYPTAENGNVAVGWTLNGDDGPSPRVLYSSHSSDGGATFSTTTVVLNDASHNPGIYRHTIVDAIRTGNNVYFLTEIQDINYTGTQVHLYLWASTDGGATFKPPQKVNVKASNDGYYATTIQAVYSPNLAASGNEVNIVWLNNDNPGSFDGWVQYSLRTRRSTDAGTTLEDPVTLHTFPGGYNQGGYPGQETIARIGNRVHVLTEKRDAPAGTFLWTSNDGGGSWGSEQRISTGGWYPHIKLDGTRVHIANSWYFRSADAGVTFDGGVNPHDQARSWDYWSMVLGADGAAHYIGCAGGASCAYDGQIMYRRLAPEPAPGTTDKVLHMTTTGNPRIENLQIAATPDINFSSAMTIEFWVRRMTDNAYYLENMISKSRASGSVGSYVISYRNDYTIYSRIITTETSTAWLGSGVSLPLGTWTHIAMTYDANGGADNWKIYVNGNLANKATVSGTIVTETPDSPLRITSSSNGAAYPGQVEIDELRLWNTARTLAEIQTGMGQPLAGTERGLTAYYNFNDTFKDMTGRGNDAVPMYFENFIDSSIIPREKTLSVTTSDHGTVSVSTGTLAWIGGVGTVSYANGVRVTLTATPDPGFSFYGWSGACTGTGSCTVTMNWEKAVTADFVLTGDINDDGLLTLMDAILALQVVSGVTPATALGKWGDGNGDGKIGLSEAIYVLQKVAGLRPGIPITYSMADLTGTWETNKLGASGSPWWSRGIFTVGSDGTFSGTSNDSSGHSASVSGAFSITNDGIVGISIQGSTVPPSYRCVMDSEKSVVVCTATTDGGNATMDIFTKKASSYSMADLVGTWQTNRLGASASPWWSRGTFTVGSDGTFSGTANDSFGQSGVSVSGAFSINNDGVVGISIQGLTMPPSNRCVMDSGKSVVVCTATTDGGNATMDIFTKKLEQWYFLFYPLQTGNYILAINSFGKVGFCRLLWPRLFLP